MANIEDYIKWRGDLSFEQDPFNEVDGLILTQLGYLDLGGVVPAWNEKSSVSMAKLMEKYWLKYPPIEEPEKIGIVRNPARLFGLLKESRRFSGLIFANYINRIDEEKQEQFAAMTTWIPDGSIYVIYRGTDATMVGWRENLNMSYMDQVPAQLEAVNYLERIFEWTNFKLRLGGHSKGGNLAVYAAMHIGGEIADKILSVDNYDGPGFREAITKHPKYSQTMKKVRTYLPESSVIGRLMEHSEEYRVVKADAIGLWQHDAFTWQVKGNSFEYAKELDAGSDMVELTVKQWLEKTDESERKQFVDTLFAVLAAAKIETVTDLVNMKWKDAAEFLKVMTDLSDGQKREFRRVINLFWKEAAEVVGKEVGDSLLEKNDGIKLQLPGLFGRKKEE